MELAGHLSYQFTQPPFDGGVDILIVRLCDKLVVGQFGAYPGQSFQQCVAFLLVNEARTGQCLGVGYAGRDVGFPESHVKADRVAKATHLIIGAIGEASPP